MKFISEDSIENVPSDFFKIVKDFANDICRVFPEYSPIVLKYILSLDSDENRLKLYNFVGKVVIQNKEDILSKNEELFVEDGFLNTEFLPRIVFSHIWSGDITETTKAIIWKYLTLLFVTISKQQVKISGDESIEGEVDLDEILSGILSEEPETPLLPETQDSEETFQSQETFSKALEGMPELPDAIKGMMGGSLGKLAMELAHETATQQEGGAPPDLFSMMGKIGSKIEGKLKSGELSESSLLEESMGLINTMGGVNNIQSMMNMFKGAGGGGMDFSAFSKAAKEDVPKINGRDRKQQKGTDKRVRQKLRGNNPRNMTDTNNEQAPEYTLPRFTDDELASIFASK
jgi:hypothetical protein